MKRYTFRCPEHGEYTAETPVEAPCPTCKRLGMRLYTDSKPLRGWKGSSKEAS